MRKPITISLESIVIQKIDDSKGTHEPRSRFIEDIISEFLEKNEDRMPNDPRTKHARLRKEMNAT